MLDLFFEGGWEFMGLISLLALCMLYFAAKGAQSVLGAAQLAHPLPANRLYYIRFFGMLALVVGVLGQMIGLYEAMKYISQQGQISQEMLAGGFRVSSITTLYGFLVFLIAHLIWFFLDIKRKNHHPAV